MGVCPRCAGDVATNRDQYGAYKECLQCGWMTDEMTIAERQQQRLDMKRRSFKPGQPKRGRPAGSHDKQPRQTPKRSKT